MRNAVQLITYADRLGGSIPGAHALVRSTFGDALGGVHLLPYFTPFDGADAGFDPVDHTEVDPRLGTWEDVRALSQDYDVMTDMIVNHVSSRSAAFLDYVEHGEASEHAPMFLTMSSVFPEGATEDELAAIYRPRPGLPFTPVQIDGRRRYVWTTFTSEQIDIAVDSAQGRHYLTSIMERLAASGVTLLRLDAVGYAVKTPGTSCFMTPETFDFIDEIAAEARALGLAVLVEVHSYFQDQVDIASRVDWVYDFALPPLLLHSVYTRDGAALDAWLAVRPVNAMTVLDTHDGIGVIDVGPDGDRPGLLTPAQIDALVEGMHACSGGGSRAATGAAASNLDLYQVNTTYYSALGEDDAAYILTRAVQFFVPGIPQVYYVGALAGSDDLELLAESGVGRDINRHRYTPDEVAAAIERPVVRDLLALMRLRSLHPAFAGTSSVAPSGDGAGLSITWTHGDASAGLDVDWRTLSAVLTLSRPDGSTASAPLGDVTRLAADVLQTPSAR